MRGIGLVILLVGNSLRVPARPRRPGAPTTSDTVRYPGDADDPLDFPPAPGGGTDSTRVG